VAKVVGVAILWQAKGDAIWETPAKVLGKAAWMV